MRILTVSNLYPPDVIGGYEIGCAHAVEALRARGHEVEVITTVPRLPTPEVAGVCRTLRLIDVYFQSEHRAPITRLLADVESNLVSAHNVHHLADAVERFRPEVAYVWNLVGTGGIGILACLQHLGVPWVWHLMDLVPPTICEMGGAVVPRLAREVTRQSRGHYIVCSQRLLDESAQRGVPLEGDVSLVPNWATGEPPPLRTSHYSGGHLRMVSAGRICREKGTHIIIEAALLLRRQGYANFSFDLYGNVVEQDLIGLIKEHDLSECIDIKGFQPPSVFPALYGDYELFVFPTWNREPFGFAPLDAAGAGCVTLLTDACGISEWLVDGVHCLKAPRNSDGFARRIREVLDGEADLLSLSRRAQTAIWQDFSLDTVIVRVEEVLRRAASESEPVRGAAAEAIHMAVLSERLLKTAIEEAFAGYA